MAQENEKPTEIQELELEWLQLHRDMDKLMHNETFVERFKRKFMSNPLVPIGVLATSIALGYGLWCFKSGERKMSQYMMRTRIAAQGFTVIALVIGMGISAKKAGEQEASQQ